MFTSAAQQEGLFGAYYTALLVFNISGVVLLTVLIAANIWRLMRQFRAQILGSRLTLRLIATFALVSLLPLGVVYYFAIQFLGKSIDSWFDVRIERALDDAMLLGQNSLAAINEDLIRQIRDQASQLGETVSGLEIIHLMDDFRELGDYAEMSLYSNAGRIIATSQDASGGLVPDSPDRHILARITRGLEFSKLEPMSDGGLQLRTVVPVPSDSVASTGRYLQVLYPMPLRFSKLGSSIQTASQEYEKLQYLRTPLKFNFVLSLSLIALMTGLIALWIAIYSSRRMMQPMRQLAEGTRAVAQGDYSTRLMETGSDELGVLVRSFNDMTRQIQQAQQQTAASRLQVEKQRTYLETLLAHLSSGVLSFTTDASLITCNETAHQILDMDISRWIGITMDHVMVDQPWTEPLFGAIYREISRGSLEWRHEISLSSNRGRQTLTVRGTKMPEEQSDFGGYVVVFDDVTELVHAQRNAAWGEVARRLAHEIKNPLTPIQLSAERIRHKYLKKLPLDEQDTLDRATRTIAHQVESMKLMVNAFAEYAQPVTMNPVETDLNRLIQDVAELHRTPNGLQLLLDLDPHLPSVSIDTSRIRQVLNNLIINTRDAANADTKPPRITIFTRTTDAGGRTWIEIVVNDNGPGFPEQLLDRIFDPYVTTKKKGTGLGLAIVRRIVEEHGGRIHAENVCDGASVTIRLPFSQGHAHRDFAMVMPAKH